MFRYNLYVCYVEHFWLSKFTINEVKYSDNKDDQTPYFKLMSLGWIMV